MEKATRVLSEEDKEMMDRPIEGRNGDLRKIEHILGRSKLKKSFQYEVKFKGMDHKVSLIVVTVNIMLMAEQRMAPPRTPHRERIHQAPRSIRRHGVVP